MYCTSNCSYVSPLKDTQLHTQAEEHRHTCMKTVHAHMIGYYEAQYLYTNAFIMASAAFLQSFHWAASIKCLTAPPQQSNYPADLWAQTLTSPLKCKRDLKSLACPSIAVGGTGWEVGASNICLAFILPYCVAGSSIRPTAGILGATIQGTHTVTGNMAGTSSQSLMVHSRLFARPLV